MKFEPRPEPSIQDKKAHKKWEREYEDWGPRRCNNGVGYFCRQHGRWVACKEVETREAPARKDQRPGQCPKRHETDAIARQQSLASTTSPRTATSSTSGTQGSNQNTPWTSNYAAPSYTSNYQLEQQPSALSYSASQYPAYAQQDLTGASAGTASYTAQSAGWYQDLSTDFPSLAISSNPAYVQPQFAQVATYYDEPQAPLPASSSKSSVPESRSHDSAKSKTSTRQYGSGKGRSAQHDSPGRHSSSKSEVKRGSAEKGDVRSSDSRGQGVNTSDTSSHRTHSRKEKGKESSSGHQPGPPEAYYATTDYYSTPAYQMDPAGSVYTATWNDPYSLHGDQEDYLDQEADPNSKQKGDK